MSSRNNIYATRSWMYERIDQKTNVVSDEFCHGVENFIRFAKNQPLFLENGKLFCPCVKCENGKPLLPEEIVSRHLYNRGFMPNYWVWISHGEDYNIVDDDSVEDDFESESHTEPVNPYVDMVSDAFGNTESGFDQNMGEEPNAEAKMFYDILDAAKNPIYDGCKEGHSQLSLAARLMSLKTDYNLPQNCMDAVSQIIKEYLPEGNTAPKSYYEIKKLMRSLGLPYHKIDVCQDNCMIFWKDTAAEENCRFCKKDRFRPTQKPGQKRVAYRQMFYLPISDRLKRLYQSNNTAKDMRWHAEHSVSSGEMCHPSDGEAWKSFHQTKFEWDASIEHLVKTNFDALAATRLKGMVSLAKSKGEKPEWILAEHWRVMVAYWNTPKAKEKSEKARSSRLFSRDGLGPHCHRSGSRSYAKVQDALEANNEDFSFIAVMKKTHQKDDGTYVDERARQIAEKYEEHVQERLAQMELSDGENLTMNPLTIEEKNDIYVQVAGISKQGRVFGLGSLQNGISVPLDGTSVPPPTTGEVETLTLRVAELESKLQMSQEETVLVKDRLKIMEQMIQSSVVHNGINSASASGSTPPVGTSATPPVGTSASPQAFMGFSSFGRTA